MLDVIMIMIIVFSIVNKCVIMIKMMTRDFCVQRFAQFAAQAMC